MTVYVDDMRMPARVGRLNARWSHLTADTREELMDFAMKIGLSPTWFQTCKHGKLCAPATCVHYHFDVTDSKRALAIANGATPITWREAGRMMAERAKALRQSRQER